MFDQEHVYYKKEKANRQVDVLATIRQHSCFL